MLYVGASYLRTLGGREGKLFTGSVWLIIKAVALIIVHIL